MISSIQNVVAHFCFDLADSELRTWILYSQRKGTCHSWIAHVSTVGGPRASEILGKGRTHFLDRAIAKIDFLVVLTKLNIIQNPNHHPQHDTSSNKNDFHCHSRKYRLGPKAIQLSSGKGLCEQCRKSFSRRMQQLFFHRWSQSHPSGVFWHKTWDHYDTIEEVRWNYRPKDRRWASSGR